MRGITVSQFDDPFSVALFVFVCSVAVIIIIIIMNNNNNNNKLYLYSAISKSSIALYRIHKKKNIELKLTSIDNKKNT